MDLQMPNTPEENREYYRKYRAANRETIRENNRRYQNCSNHDKIAERKNELQRKRDKTLEGRAKRLVVERRHKEKHPEKRSAIQKTWRDANQDYILEQQLLTDYSITLAERETIAISQNYVCAICGNPETKIHAQTGTTRYLSVDHYDRDDGNIVVRGLLCSDCNLAIGNMNHNPTYLRNAADYLDKNPELFVRPRREVKKQLYPNSDKQMSQDRLGTKDIIDIHVGRGGGGSQPRFPCPLCGRESKEHLPEGMRICSAMNCRHEFAT